MSLNDRFKAERDRERFYAYQEMHPEIIPEALLRAYGEKPQQGHTANLYSAFAGYRKHEKLLDLSLIKHLVGDGYVRPTEPHDRRHPIQRQRYLLTRKGKEAIERYLQKGNTTGKGN